MTGQRSSLRARLLGGLAAVIVFAWAVVIGLQFLEATRERTGRWDRALMGAGQQILMSLPPLGGIGDAPQRPYRLPDALRRDGDPLQGMVYQAWLRDGRLVLQSAGAPATPLLPLGFERGDRFGEADIGGERWRVYALSDAAGQVEVLIGKSRSHYQGELWRWLWASLRYALLLGALLAVITWWTVERALSPATTLARSLAARPPLDLRPIATAGLPGELEPMVASFNALLVRLDSALQLERRFLADAAHELRTPLAALQAQAQAALAATTIEQGRASLQPLIDGIARAARLSEQMLDLAHVDALEGRCGSRQPVHELLALLVRDFAGAARNRGQRLMLHTEPCHAVVLVDALGVLVRNLIDNAIRHAGEGARIEVRCQHEPADRAAGGPDDVVLTVRDDGVGVPTDERERIFDRFYRVGGRAGDGSGIGLSLVARIARLHGAGIEVGEGLEGRGLAIRVRLAAGAGPSVR